MDCPDGVRGRPQKSDLSHSRPGGPAPQTPTAFAWSATVRVVNARRLGASIASTSLQDLVSSPAGTGAQPHADPPIHRHSGSWRDRPAAENHDVRSSADPSPHRRPARGLLWRAGRRLHLNTPCFEPHENRSHDRHTAIRRGFPPETKLALTPPGIFAMSSCFIVHGVSTQVQSWLSGTRANPFPFRERM